MDAPWGVQFNHNFFKVIIFLMAVKYFRTKLIGLLGVARDSTGSEAGGGFGAVLRGCSLMSRGDSNR